MQLYKTLCLFVGLLVLPRVCQAFLEKREFKYIQVYTTKSKKIQENSFILKFIGRIVVRIELVLLNISLSYLKN